MLTTRWCKNKNKNKWREKQDVKKMLLLYETSTLEMPNILLLELLRLQQLSNFIKSILQKQK